MLKVQELYKSYNEDSHPLQGVNIEVGRSETILLNGSKWKWKIYFY